MATKKEAKEIKVLKKFIDKKSKQLYNVGDSFESTKARIEELTKLGYSTSSM